MLGPVAGYPAENISQPGICLRRVERSTGVTGLIMLPLARETHPGFRFREVGWSERVSSRASRLVGSVVRAVRHGIHLVFAGGSPPEVLQAVVGGDSVQVPTNRTRRARANESFKDQPVDHSGLQPAPLDERDGQVPLCPNRRGSLAALDCVPSPIRPHRNPRERSDSSVVAYLVNAFIPHHRVPPNHTQILPHVQRPPRCVRMDQGVTTMPFTRNALIRAIRTAAQTAIGAIGAATLVAQVDWPLVASTVALATILSLLTSLTGLPEDTEK